MNEKSRLVAGCYLTYSLPLPLVFCCSAAQVYFSKGPFFHFPGSPRRPAPVLVRARPTTALLPSAGAPQSLDPRQSSTPELETVGPLVRLQTAAKRPAIDCPRPGSLAVIVVAHVHRKRNTPDRPQFHQALKKSPPLRPIAHVHPRG